MLDKNEHLKIAPLTALRKALTIRGEERRVAERAGPGRHAQRYHPPPATQPLIQVPGLDGHGYDGRSPPGPAEDAAQADHDLLADVSVDGDLGERGRPQRAPNELRVADRGQPEQFLVA